MFDEEMHKEATAAGFVDANLHKERAVTTNRYNNDSRKKESEIADGEIRNGTTMLKHRAGFADTVTPIRQVP